MRGRRSRYRPTTLTISMSLASPRAFSPLSAWYGVETSSYGSDASKSLLQKAKIMAQFSSIVINLYTELFNWELLEEIEPLLYTPYPILHTES